MDRPIAYTSEQGRSTDFLFAQRATMIGLGKLAKAMLGSTTVVEGLAVTPTTPASLNVQVGSGQIYSMESVDATAYGTLPADTADSIVKQGLLMAAATLATPAPTTAGDSINYLIQAIYQDQDTNNVVLPYFNSANPSQPLSGQNNSGAAQPTERQGVCVVAVKAGAAATTGSQTTPAPDAGYTGLAVVTVANGQTTVTSSNIAVYASVPQITNLLQMLQTGSPITANDTGTAGAYAITLTPAPLAITPGMIVGISAIIAANPGASTLNTNGLGTLPIHGPGSTALQGGEFVAGGNAILRANANATAWDLVWTTGAQPVASATKANQAINLGQFVGPIASRAALSVAAGASLSTSVSFTAPCKGVVLLTLGMNKASISQNFQLTLNGAVLDSNLYPNIEVQSAVVAAAGPQTFTASALNQGTAAESITLNLGCVFVPTT